MIEHLKVAFPDAEVLLALEPEELAGKMLFIFRHYGGNMFNISAMEGELRNAVVPGSEHYPRAYWPAIGLALREAGAWLSAQGLIIPADSTNGRNGYCVLSRRAQHFQNEVEFASYSAARRVPREILHPRIGNSVWMAFMRNEFDVAAFLAMKAVEVAVREVAGLSDKDIGVNLMRKAFDKHIGPLTDLAMDEGEREARAHLFAGAIGSYKNPHSHRNVDLSEPAEAAEIVMLANLLLRIVDGCAARLGK